jgi:hypothetical protein
MEIPSDYANGSRSDPFRSGRLRSGCRRDSEAFRRRHPVPTLLGAQGWRQVAPLLVRCIGSAIGVAVLIEVDDIATNVRHGVVRGEHVVAPEVAGRTQYVPSVGIGDQ